MARFDFLLKTNSSFTITLKSGTKYNLVSGSYDFLDSEGNQILPANNGVVQMNNAVYIKIKTSSAEHNIMIEDIEIVEPSKSTHS